MVATPIVDAYCTTSAADSRAPNSSALAGMWEEAGGLHHLSFSAKESKMNLKRKRIVDCICTFIYLQKNRENAWMRGNCSATRETALHAPVHCKAGAVGLQMEEGQLVGG